MKNIYTKKYIKKNGEEVFYKYEKDSSPYTRNSYLKKIEDPKITCPNCGRKVYKHYLEAHKNNNICKKNTISLINNA
jgi:hypothetical protein